MELIDGYPESMRESIALVERTRPARLGVTFPAMSLEERKTLLTRFHPDYKANQKRALLFGPSKGMVVSHELADLFEARPLIRSSLDLTKIDTEVDLLVIGGGGAGTVAAIWAVKEGLDPNRVLVATKLRHGDSNSTMAQGGIQAADRPHDSPIHHYLDVMGGGHFTNRPELVRALVNDAPQIIQWHESLGVMYDKDAQGHFVENPGGGTSRNRMHSARDYTGLEIMRVLRDEARNLGIPVVEFSPAIELLCDERGHVAGAVLVAETEWMAKAAGLGDIVLQAKSGYIDGMVDSQDPLYRKIIAQLPAGAKPSDYITSLEITARKASLNCASNALPLSGGCCG